jgi:hypothetical protein
MQNAVVEAARPRLIPIDPHNSFKAAALDWIATCLQSSIGAPFVFSGLTFATRAAWLAGCVVWEPVFTSMPSNISSPLHGLQVLVSQLARLTASTTILQHTQAEYQLTKTTRHSIAQAITNFRSPYALLHDASGQIEDYAITTRRSP